MAFPQFKLTFHGFQFRLEICFFSYIKFLYIFPFHFSFHIVYCGLRNYLSFYTQFPSALWIADYIADYRSTSLYNLFWHFRFGIMNCKFQKCYLLYIISFSISASALNIKDCKSTSILGNFNLPQAICPIFFLVFLKAEFILGDFTLGYRSRFSYGINTFFSQNSNKKMRIKSKVQEFH